MGAWGTKPLDNDGALDLKTEWDDTNDIEVIENALDTVLSGDAEEYIDVIDGESAIAAVYIVVNDVTEIPNVQYTALLQKSAGVLGRLVENSELKDVWAETESFGDWLSGIVELMKQITEKLKLLE